MLNCPFGKKEVFYKYVSVEKRNTYTDVCMSRLSLP